MFVKSDTTFSQSLQFFENKSIKTRNNSYIMGRGGGARTHVIILNNPGVIITISALNMKTIIQKYTEVSGM